MNFLKSFSQTAYDTSLRSTDPELVKMELDCGWIAAASYDPVAYLKKYPNRYRPLQIEAFKSAAPSLTLSGPKGPKPTELGHGGICYKPVFAAAQAAKVERYYVKQSKSLTTSCIN